MDLIKNKVGGYYRHLTGDSLYRNSLYLMINTGFLAATGFIFWIIAARFYSVKTVGITTTLIASGTLLSGISLLGVNHSFIRFMPNHQNHKALLDTGFTIVTISAILTALIFSLLTPHISPELAFIHDNVFVTLFFTAFIVFSTLNVLTDGYFLSKRSAKYTLYANIAQAALKLVLPFCLGAFALLGLFISHAMGVIGAMVMSFYFIWRKFKYLPRINIVKKEVIAVSHYSLINHFASLLQIVPAQLLPILITSRLSPQQSGFFYLASMITTLLYIIPQATTQSLFAEGSHDHQGLKAIVVKGVKLISIILLPALISVLLCGGLLLKVFGDSYSRGGVGTLRILAVSAIFIAINSVANSILKVTMHVKFMLYVYIITAAVTMALALLLVDKGIIYAAYSYLIGQVLASILFVGYLLQKRLL